MIAETISHYRILAKLGQGGMGVVYKAEDTKLDRLVALKLLAPELTRDPEAKIRFVREAKAAAALNHPNIATIYEIDEADDITFIAMEFVAGVSLKQKLAAGPLAMAEALAITIQIATGLARAHSQGIVHRDIKPGNILLTSEGGVKIVDFGLAKLAGDTQLTRTGLILGTVAYMSPEQARGDEVTAQTDIWALGVIHYEMLTGRLPFRGENPQAQIYSILNRVPEPLTRLDEDIPEFQDQATRMALVKDPGSRFRSVQDFAGALQDPTTLVLSAEVLSTQERLPVPRHRMRLVFTRGYLITAGLLLAAVIALGYFALEKGGAHDFAERDWLLITEFQDLSDEGNLQSALREALTIDMQQSRHVNVFSGKRLTDALARMGREADEAITLELANELAIRETIPVVLTGSASKLGELFLVTAQLVDPQTGGALFAKRVEAENIQALLPALDELSLAIRERLGESLRSIRSNDQPLAMVTTASLPALRLFSDGNRAFLASDWDRAIALLGQAVVEDSTFAMAYAKLARIYFYNASTRDALGYSEMAYRWRERLTSRERFYIEGEHYRYRAQYSEAINSLRTLLENYPDDLESRTNLAATYMFALRYEDALREMAKLDPSYQSTWSYHHTLGNVYGGLGDYPAALREFELAKEVNPSQLRTLMCIGWIHLCREDDALARAALDSLAASSISSNISKDYLLARGLPGRGEFGRALAHLAVARSEALNNNNQNQAAWTHVHAGLCHDRRREFDLAVEAFESAVALWPGSFPLQYLGQARARLKLFEEAADAVRRLEELHRQEPTNSNRHALAKLRAEISYRQGDYPRAIELLQECLPTFMYNLDGRFMLGQAQMAAGDLAEAAASFAFVIEHRYSTFHKGLASLWPLSHYHLGLVALEVGDAVEAERQFETILRIWAHADDGLPEVEDARQRLQVLRSS